MMEGFAAQKLTCRNQDLRPVRSRCDAAARMNAERLPPGLHIVATPIGNLGDLSPRAADTLRRADLVLAEDKRVTAKLLSHAGAKTKLANYSDHTSGAERDAIVARLGDQAIALVSDAGTPLISDPGYKLVRAAQRLYGRNVFPKMKVTWGTHVNNLGHMDSPGCFRCHDDQHQTADGRVIKQDCDLCHDIQ